MNGGNTVLLGDITDSARIPLRADIDTGRWDLYPLRASRGGLAPKGRATKILAEWLGGIGVDEPTGYHSTTGES
jgi:hypothetical protein